MLADPHSPTHEAVPTAVRAPRRRRAPRPLRGLDLTDVLIPGLGADVVPYLELRQRPVRLLGEAPIRTPPQAEAFFRPLLDDCAEERALVLLVDARHRPIGWAEVARGNENVVN